MRIGFVSQWNLDDAAIRRRVFSEIIWNMLKEFEAQGDEVEYIGPVESNLVSTVMTRGSRKLNHLEVFNPPLEIKYHPLVLQQKAKLAEQSVAKQKVDVLIAQSSTIMAHFKPGIPLVYWRDANFADIHARYKDYSDLHPMSVAWAHQHEERAMNRAELNLFSSECSYKTATETYKIPPQKVAVVPFGANHDYDLTLADVEGFIARRSRDNCRLLFIGIDWKRKGGDVAVETCRILNQSGIPTTLDIVGASFEVDPAIRSQVTMHGHVDKFSQEGRKQLREMLEQAHFLIHPAHAEAFGCALCEACSFGVPCAASTVGGIPTIVKEGKSGRIFPPGTPAATYAAYIGEVFRDYDQYAQLARTTFLEYQQRLNWQVAVSKARELIQQVVLQK